jgi:phosphate transport system substrate-binding protein
MESDRWGHQSQFHGSTGIGAPGNEGVADAIKRSPNTIGYVELNYALTTGIPYALLKNTSGPLIWTQT